MQNKRNLGALTNLLKGGKKISLAKGQVIHDPEHKNLLNVVGTGFIKRYSIDNNGAQSIQVIYGPEDVFPLTPVFKTVFNLDLYHGPETFHYEALVDSELFAISQDALSKALVASPTLYKDLLYVSGERLNSNIHRLENISLRTTHRRIAHMLYFAAGTFGEKTKEGIVLTIPLTHQTLADSLSLARETVTRRLTRLEEKGLIKVGRHIVILDLDGLKKEAY